MRGHIGAGEPHRLELLAGEQRGLIGVVRVVATIPVPSPQHNQGECQINLAVRRQLGQSPTIRNRAAKVALRVFNLLLI